MNPGRYFVLVYSANGDYNSSASYRLDISLQEGTLLKPTVIANQVTNFGTCLIPNPAVTTLYLINSTRIDNRFGAGAASNLKVALSTSNILSLTNGYIFDFQDIINQCALLNNDQTNIDTLYQEWDNNPAQPLYANEVARKIREIILRLADPTPAQGQAIFPELQNLVIIGEDDSIPFFRVIDETTIAPEQLYASELGRNQGGTAGLLDPNRPLYGSLFYNFIQTDNYYSDEQPTPWRGRALYMPDMATGRLVGTPADIQNYLLAMGAVSLKIDASQSISGKAGAAFVSGYDFLTDQAQQTARRLELAGFNPAGTLEQNHTLNTLINDSWTSDDLTNIWFSGQLPQLTENYLGPHTNYHLMSINGHFSHYDLIPADQNAITFDAQRILSPTSYLGSSAFSYFLDSNAGPGSSASLVYSVGCHAGLSVPDNAIAATADPTGRFQADWASTILKQGGNLIANTGYGYGDSDTVAYSEKLSLLLTEALTRDTGGQITLGEALLEAKYAYIEIAGPGSLSAFDEKVLLEMNLYGLPDIEVLVPSPVSDMASLFNDPFDSTPQPVPANEQGQALITRIITLTNSFRPSLPGNPPELISSIEDSFLPGTQTLRGVNQTQLGLPVMPTLSYDITLDSTTNPALGSGIPIPRGVQLRSVSSERLDGYDPHVTTIITEEILPEQQDDTALSAEILSEWFPEQPYTYQRIKTENESGIQISDMLMVTPAQFNPSSVELGELRRFKRMVFQVTYLDPRNAGTAIIQDDIGPIVDDITIGSEDRGMLLSIEAHDVGAAGQGAGEGIAEIVVLSSFDETTWQRHVLKYNSTTQHYEGYLTNTSIQAVPTLIIHLSDRAGNSSVHSLKGDMQFYVISMPLVGR